MPKPENPTPEDYVKTAAALKYDSENTPVPILAAKGKGAIADQIIKLAKENNIPVRSDADLVNILEKLEVDQEIPMEIYAVVAEIFSYIYKLQNQSKAR